MTTFLDITAVVSNLGIALAYVLNGIAFAPRLLVVSRHRWAGQILKWCAAIFFIMCALTHVELMLHAMANKSNQGGVGDWFYTWHGHIIHHPQAIAGLLFFVIFRFCTDAVIIGNRDAYEAVIDKRIADRVRELEDRSGS